MCFRRKSTERLDEYIIVLIYKDKVTGVNVRVIEEYVLIILGKMSGRILIEKVSSLTEGLIGKVQCEFRSIKRCVDQVFVMK